MAHGRRPVRLVEGDHIPDIRVRINWKAIGVLLSIGLALVGAYTRFVNLERGQEHTTKAIENLESRIDRIADKVGAY